MPLTTILPTIRNTHAWPVLLCATATLALLSTHGARAGDARQSVKARQGEIVLLRAVSTRLATRMQPAGMALLVDPRPNRELKSVLGASSELDDLQIGALIADPVRATTPRFGGAMTQALGAIPNRSVRSATAGGAASGMAPVGAVGQATRALGITMQQALRAIPVPSGPH